MQCMTKASCKSTLLKYTDTHFIPFVCQSLKRLEIPLNKMCGRTINELQSTTGRREVAPVPTANIEPIYQLGIAFWTVGGNMSNQTGNKENGVLLKWEFFQFFLL